jgi:hypothetical protein
MANNPVQIVLNSQNYVQKAFNPPGGSIKDFFAGRNHEFISHQRILASQLSEIAQTYSSLPPDEVFYARVELQTSAWAKSHRPIQKMFTPKTQPLVGGAELGALVVEMTNQDIPRLVSVVESAEAAVRLVENKKKEIVPKPTKVRSEVGAISKIRPYSVSDRRKFSLDEAVRWLADPRTGRAYYVETFVSEESAALRETEKLRERGRLAIASFEAKLHGLNLPIAITKITEEWIKSSIYVVKIDEAVAEDASAAKEVHIAILAFLDTQSIVKSILLPPILQSSKTESDEATVATIPAPNHEFDYPVVGIVDTGVSTINVLDIWKSGACDFLNSADQDFAHGTFIAGLISAGDVLNAGEEFNERRCRYFDLGLHPTSESQYVDYYPRGFIDFLEQLDAEIPAAKAAGVRVLNMSLAVTTPVADDSYSLIANLLDSIADKHDVLFILPAGNLEPSLIRDEWPEDPSEAASFIAGYRFPGQDKIYQPADSIRSLVVGAINPINAIGAYLPSQYTRRGPGPALGAKPDLAHVGGRYHSHSGLTSLTPSGRGIQSCGTSFAAPLVAKTVAVIDHMIEGEISREALMALVVHHAKIPSNLHTPQLKHFIKDFIGSGIPSTAENTLLVEDHEITLVFNGVLTAGHELKFQFTWPASLVDEKGRCSGNVKLTLVHKAPVDRNFGGEFVRINLDAYLRQEVINTKTGEVTFKGRLKNEGSKRLEKELIEHGAKWWPIKTLSDSLKNIGHSSQWRLVVDPLTRSGFVIPEEGVPFTAVLTISDIDKSKPVFNEMRLQLQQSGTQISDIRSALRPRIR